MPLSTMQRGRGRPRKYDEPSRAVTLTLPESVIASLNEVDTDLGYAVTGLARTRLPQRIRRPAEVVMRGHHAVISVEPTPALEQRLGVELVPLPDGRALLAFDALGSAAELEVRVQGALDDPSLPANDRPVLEGVRDILRDARLSARIDVRPRQILVLTRRRARRGDAPRG